MFIFISKTLTESVACLRKTLPIFTAGHQKQISGYSNYHSFFYNGRARRFLMILLIAVVCSITGSSYAATSGDQNRILTTKKVVVGFDQKYPPFEYVDSDGAPTGFNVELLKAIGDTMGIQLEFRSNVWENVRKEIESGDTDMVSGMYYSRERADLVDFSVPFIMVYYSIFTRNNSTFESIDSLKNKQVLVIKGDIAHDFFKNTNLAEKIIPVNNAIEALNILAQGEYDCALLPDLLGQYLTNQHNIKKVSSAGVPILMNKYCFAVKKDQQELLDILDQGLKRIRQSGKYSQIREKWFGVIENQRFEKIIKIGTGILSFFFILMGIGWFWNLSLRRHVKYKTQALEQELTAHQKTLNSLKDRKAHLTALVESSSDGILTLNRNFYIDECNSSFCKQFGIDKSNPGYVRIDSVFYNGNDFSGFKKEIQDSTQVFGSWRGEWNFKNLDGVKIPVEITVSTKIKIDSAGGGYVAIVRDISGRIKAEKEKQSLEQQVQQVQKMQAIGSLAGGIAHDFNNILSSIICYTELSRRALPENSQPRTDLDEVIEAANQAKNLVRQILTYSRRSSFERETLQLDVIIQQSVKLLIASLPANIEIEYNCLAQHSDIAAEPTQMNQVVLNLATNAIHAMQPDGGNLKIQLASVDIESEEPAPFSVPKTGQYLKLSVEDTGHGIGEDIMKRVFDPFFTTKGRAEGTGMGLSVVHGIVNNHEGAVTVDSQIEKGSTFNVYLPQLFVKSVNKTKTAPIAMTGNEHILLVDDQEKVAHGYQRMLVSLGYTVDVALNHRQVWQLFFSKMDDYDLVLTDMSMPEVDGAQLSKQLLSKKPELPIIIYSGFGDSINLKEAKKAGVRAFLSKPVTTEKLASTIRNVLDKDSLDMTL